MEQATGKTDFLSPVTCNQCVWRKRRKGEGKEGEQREKRRRRRRAREKRGRLKQREGVEERRHQE